MIIDIINKIRRILSFANRRDKIILAGGIIGHAVNRLLIVWMIADLTAEIVIICQAGDFSELWKAVLYRLPLLLLVVAINSFSTWLCGLSTASISKKMRESVFSSILSSSLEESRKTHSGKVLSYFGNDIPVAVESLIPSLSQPARAFFIGIGGLVYVLFVHPAMAGVAILIGIFSFIYSILFAGWLHRIAEKMQAFLALLEIRLRDLLDGMVTVRMFSMRENLESEMDKTSASLRDTGVLWARASGLLGGMNNFTSTVTDQILIFAAGLLFLGGSLELSELIRVAQMAGGIISVFHISRLLISVQKSLVGAERVFDYLDTIQAEESESPTAKTSHCNEKHNYNHREKSSTLEDPAITFEHVNFRYAGVIPVLKDISFSIKKGEFVALIGASGNGKSTVLRLIQGLYRPNSGTVKIGEIPLSDWNLKALRETTVLVPQDIALFPGTIEENISIGLEDIPFSQIEEAAKKAGAHSFISEMPQGYKTPVSERGGSLSGGQRQRIAIARALLRDAPILLLDEATSAMDSKSERAIYETLHELKGEKTILFVTHRTSVLEIADRVISL